jgi:GH43 family beta-xylosidase
MIPCSIHGAIELRLSLSRFIFGLLTVSAAAFTSAWCAEGRPLTFTNPIAKSGADPWVIRWQNSYLYCRSAGNKIWIHRAPRLQDIGRVKGTAVWSPPPNKAYSKELWAPELFRLQNRWYIYVAADNGNNHNHRMYVLERDAKDPQGTFTFKGKIASPDDHWAIDGTVLKMDNGRLYFIWSGWEGNKNVSQQLYIAPMSNPWTISGPRVLISKPERPWELNGRPLINEGAEVLRNGKRVFVVYSASGSWTDDYCLGLLQLTGPNPLNASAWKKKPQAVFARTRDVFGPGHASFVKSPDGREDWIVYHAAKRKGSGWDRNVRMQKFEWNKDGTPNFGKPVSTGIALPVPSGSAR